MLSWINILHFYQPPTTSKEILDEAVKSSYRSWADFLNQNKKLKVTVNFTGCLTERLFNSGYQKLLKQFSKIAERRQIEFLESAAFHPILPLLPEKEIVKQIKINHDISCRRFGKVYQPKGFYLPEMAYSDKVGKVVKRLGYKYVILDEIAYSTNGHEFKTNLNESRIDTNVKYKIKNMGLNVVFRNRKLSQTFVPETILKNLEEREKNISVNQCSHQCESVCHIITATDGELYGHKFWNWWPAYIKAIEHKSIKAKKIQTPPLTKRGLGGVKTTESEIIKTLTISEYLKSLKVEKAIQPLACSWESTSAELKRGVPYALWNNPKNKIHGLLWQLANFALELNWKNQKDLNHFASRLHLEKGLASCTFWWASGKDFQLYAPPAWNPSMVEAGAFELLNSVRSLNKINPQSKLRAEKLFSQVRELVWQKHWKK